MLGRRPLSDSTIAYEENAIQETAEVKLVHFGERRNSFSTQASSDGDDVSDDGSKPSTSGRSLASARGPEQLFRFRSTKGTKTAFECDCPQSQKAKRKAAKSKLFSASSGLVPFPVVPNNDESNLTRRQRKDSSFMNRVKKWFCDSGSPTNCDNDEPQFTSKVVVSSSKSAKPTTSTETEPSTSRSGKKDLQRKERHYIISDILAVTNCSYYWGSINRHEAEEVSNYEVLFKFYKVCCVYTIVRIVGSIRYGFAV